MKTIVIAEIGENHYGRWDVCRGMVEETAANGATIAKFQTYTADQFGKDHQWHEWFHKSPCGVGSWFVLQRRGSTGGNTQSAMRTLRNDSAHCT